MAYSNNLSENRIRGTNKIISGSKMVIEGGKLPIIICTLGRGGALRVIGDSSTQKIISTAVRKQILNALLHSALEPSEMTLMDSNQHNISERKETCPLLPNAISSKFWNQNYVKEYLSQLLKFLGYGSGGIPFGQGSVPPGFPEDKIKWCEFRGPSATNFKGNYVEVLFQIIESILKHFEIDGESHVVNPPYGKFVPKSKRNRTNNIAENKTTENDNNQAKNPIDEHVENNREKNVNEIAENVNDEQSFEENNTIEKSNVPEENNLEDLEMNINNVISSLPNVRANKSKSTPEESDSDDTDTEVLYDDSSDDSLEELIARDRQIVAYQMEKNKLQNITHNEMGNIENVDTEKDDSTDKNDDTEKDDSTDKNVDTEKDDSTDETETDQYQIFKYNLSVGKIRKMFNGTKCRKITVQIATLQKMMPINDRYGCSISDGKDYVENVCFDPSLSTFVQRSLSDGTVIEIQKYSLISCLETYDKNSKSVIAILIESFKPLHKVTNIIGSPQLLSNIPINSENLNENPSENLQKRKTVPETPIARKTRSRKKII